MDWSSEDWDGEKAKAREQCPLLDFNFLEKQIRKTLQDPIQDISLDLLASDNKIEKDLMQDMQALTLKGDMDTQKSADIQVTNVQEPENNNKVKEEDETSVPPYKMTKQELQLHEEEEKYNIYTSTFGYEGDDSSLDSKTETESEGHAYPFLD